MSNNKKRKTVINRRELVDSSTGESFEATEIVQVGTDLDFDFDKVWVAHIMTIIEEIGNAKMKVIGWMIKNRDRRTNRIIATQEDIAEAINVSRKTVALTLKALKDADIISMRIRGVYRLNPNFIFYGGAEKRQNIIYRYIDESEPVKDKVSKIDVDKIEDEKPRMSVITTDLSDDSEDSSDDWVVLYGQV